MDEESDVSVWKKCPPEILLLIFEMLDVKTLLNCMIVSQKWWNIACNIVQRIGWEKLGQLVLPDRAASLRKKTKLDLEDMIFNLCLWQDVCFAQPRNTHTYDICDVLNINVYRDNLIIVTHWEVKYFDLETFKLKRTLPITCINFDENDYMFVKVEITLDINSKIDKFRKLTLYGKDTETSDMDGDKTFLHRSVLYHRLHENCCYYIISEYCIFVATWSNDAWITQVVARYFGFGTIIDISIDKEDVLALLNWGGMLQIGNSGVKFKRNETKRSSVILEIPKYSDSVTLYGMNGAVAAVPTLYPFRIKFNEPEFWVLECPDLTCTLKHGNMILLGYRDGKVDIFNPSKFLNENAIVPQLSFNVERLARHDVCEPAVRRLEVAEMETEVIGDLHMAVRSAFSASSQRDEEFTLPPLIQRNENDSGAAGWCDSIEVLYKELNWKSNKTSALSWYFGNEVLVRMAVTGKMIKLKV